jgi:hypothetical protein
MPKQSNIEKKVKKCADKIRPQANPSSYYLVEPVFNCDFIEEAEFNMLCLWGIFNPMGPTMMPLALIPLPGGSEHLLVYRMINPVISENIVFGLLPDKAVNDTDQLMGCLDSLFRKNGSPGCPLMISLPTFVTHKDNFTFGDSQCLILTEGQVRELFWAVIPKLEIEDIELDCKHLREFKGDPWARTGLEFEEALKETSELQRENKEINRELFDVWFELVIDKEHVYSEISAIGRTQ